jgi:hypothetical protein
MAGLRSGKQYPAATFEAPNNVAWRLFIGYAYAASACILEGLVGESTPLQAL